MARGMIWRQFAALVLAGGMTGGMVGSAHAAYVVNGVLPPGALWMQTMAINDNGDFVGGLAWAAGGGGGFVYRNGGYSMLPLPAETTNFTATGISNGGVMVGTSNRPVPGNPNSFQRVAYIYDGSSFQELTLPGATFVEARSISSDGRYVSGWYGRSNAGAAGYIYDRQLGTQVATIDVGAGSSSQLQAGVNRHGQAVGSFNRSGQRWGYVFDLASGVRTDFAFVGVANVSPRGINDSGQIAGWFQQGASTDTFAGWVGSATAYEVVAAPIPGWGAVLQGMNNLGQVAGYYNRNPPPGESSIGAGFIVSPAAQPVGPGPAPYSHRFDVPVRADQPVFIDPLVAVGYRYEVGAGDPLFKSVSLPVGIGDNLYEVVVGNMTLPLLGHQILDFTTLGFADGVASFTVLGIEPEAMLDPTGQGQFVTRLTFAANGRFTGTQTAITAVVPEPTTLATMQAGLLLVALLARLRQQAGGSGRSRRKTG